MKCELRISWADGSKSAVDVARILRELGVSATVTEGWSVCPVDHVEEHVRELERSVVIEMYSVTKRKIVDSIWPALRDSFGLTCAYVHEDGIGFNGCILDYDTPTNCPHRQVADAAAATTKKRRRRKT